MGDTGIENIFSEFSSVFTLHKRSLSEFQILKQIGEGGFSKVYKVRNILENKEYALKKIEIETEGKSTKKIRKELENQLREIKYLSQLQNNTNQIVKYIQSWVDVKEGKIKKGTDCIEGILINDVVYKLNQIKKFKIFIQMELCKETLADYLISRQNKLFTLATDNLFAKEDIKKYINIFKLIVKSVEYVHNQGIIHRDLKPANIFIDKYQIKLGDFGLATDINDVKYENKTKLIVNDDCLNYHSKNIGTPLYASNEQLNDNFYNEKCDIFSLGMILFELIYPLKTHMEKREKLSDLRKGKLPENLVEAYKSLSELILSMTNSILSKRPSAKSILNKLEEIDNERIDAEKLIKRNRFFSDDVKERSNAFDLIDIDSSEIFVKISNELKFVFPVNLRTITNSYRLIESTLPFSINDMIGYGLKQSKFNIFVKSKQYEDSWELIGKNIDEKSYIK